MNYIYDAIALSPDPNLNGLNLDYGSHKGRFASAEGTKLVSLVRSRAGVLLILGAVTAAPTRPPVVALEHLLATELGAVAFEDDMKRFTGRLVRQIIEHLGGRWVRSGVKVTVRSRYSKGSIYEFSNRARSRTETTHPESTLM